MKTRMFRLWSNSRIKTVNPIHGCRFKCYHGRCWASRMAKRLQAMGIRGYENGFEPTFCPWQLNKRFKPGEIVFIGSMGDLSFFSLDIQREIVEKLIITNPQTIFLLETKNPAIYHKLVKFLPANVILSTTIETNRDYGLSLAPPPETRYLTFREVQWDKKHVAIEPIMDFDLAILTDWIKEINPIIVSVGYDNYNCGLPEPSLDKTLKLISKLKEFTDVEIKNLREGNK